MTSTNPFFEPRGGEGENTSSPSSNVFAASPPDQLEHPSPFSLDEEAENDQIDKIHALKGHARESLPPSLLLWESVFSSFPQAVVILDDQQRILYTNPAHSKLLGTVAGKNGAGMEDWFREVCPDQSKAAKIISSWHEHIWRNQLTRTFALNHVKKGLRHIEFRSALSPHGCTIVLHSDVTDEMASEEALRQANLKFRHIFANSTGGIVVVNREGLMLDLNNAFAEFAGKSARELIGKPFLDILHLEDAAALRESEAKDLLAVSDHPRKLRFVFEDQDQERPAVVSASYISNNEAEATLKLYQLKPRDNQLIAKLHELSAKAQSLLDAVPNMFVLLDREGRVKDWSAPANEWECSLDFSKESIGQLAREVWPEFGILLDSNLANVFEGGPAVRLEVPLERVKAVFPVTLASFGKELALALIDAPSSQNQLWQSHFFSSSSEAVLVTTHEADIIEANPAASILLGQSHSALTRSNLFQLLTKAPGTSASFDLKHLNELTTEKEWSDLWSISPSGPQPVSAKLIPVTGDKGQIGYFVAIIQSKQVERLAEAVVRDLAQSQFRSQLQTITSLFAIASEGQESASSVAWLIRLKVLAESMTSSKRIGIVNLLRDIADQVSSAAGRGLGPREVVINGSRSLTIENEIATPLALFAGEVISLGICGGEKGPGPSLYLDVESYEGNILLTAKAGENRKPFTLEKLENAKVMEFLVEQIRGKFSIGVGDDNNQTPSLRLAFPCQQS